MTISTSLRSAQHPSTGQNIQHTPALEEECSPLHYNDVHCCFQELKNSLVKILSRTAFLIESVLKTGCLEIC